MDPFGVLSFVIDNAERLKSALDQVGEGPLALCFLTPGQVRANDEAIVAQTDRTAASLQDLQDIFDGLRSPNHAALPAGLQKDLDRMKDRWVRKFFEWHH
jgi:hypothetical protein